MVARAAATYAVVSNETLAEIVHDMCTPLSSVGTAVDLLLDRIDSMDRVQAADLLQRVRDGTRWLQELVADLTDAPHLTPGADSFVGAPFNLGMCAERGISVALPLLAARGQRVKLLLPDRPVIVWGDEHQIRRVVLNLLSNAAKYAPPGDDISVSVTLRAKRVAVTVADSGPGIDWGERERIFEPRVRGVRADDATGRGLGLSIVKSLVELHGGVAGVRDDGERGTVFWFSLPRLGARRRRPAA